MTEVKFFDVGNVADLFDFVDNCIGPVHLKAGDNNAIELRKNEDIKKLLSDVCCGNVIKKMCLVINDKRDMPKVINYLISQKRK